MAFKIAELRRQYGLMQTFETEEEALAYEAERQAAYEARIAEKVQELKDLYNSDTQKYSKFKNFTEDDWIDYAKICIKTASAIKIKYALGALPSVENDPEIAKWAQFSYEEILQMESDGVLIPKEVLEWAHSMQDSDVTAYEINDDSNATEEIEETSTNSPNSELKELQKRTQTLSNKSENTQAEISQNFDKFKEIADKAEQIKQEQETTKKDSLKQIEELTKEWDEISAKIKNGDKLSESEQKRYKELGSMLNGKDGELVTDIQASSDDLQALIDSMDGLNNEITSSIEIGDETVEAAKQLSLYEKGYTRKSTNSNNIINVTIGTIRNALQGTLGKDIAEDALDNGNNLIEFSNTLSDQLMMNQYASLYDFAEIFTQTSTETITNTKEVLGDDFNKTTAELNEQIDALPDMTKAESEQAALEEKGVGLIGQTLYFTGKSSLETQKSFISMITLALTQRQSEKETEKSQKLTDTVVDKMTAKKEELDDLQEKKEKAEEKKDKTIEMAKNTENAQGISQNLDEDEFTEEDQQRLEKLDAELEKTGNFTQNKLYQSLTKVQNYGNKVQDDKLNGTDAVDYGQVTQDLGKKILDQFSPSFAILYFYLYAISSIAILTGKVATAAGEENIDLFDETNSVITSNQTSIGQSQISIQELTNVAAIAPAASMENDSEQTATDTQNSASDSTSDSIETSATGTSEIIKDATETGTERQTDGVEESQTGAAAPIDNEEGVDNANDEEEVTTDDAENNVGDVKSATEEENEDSVEKKAETEKTEDELEQEMKILEKNMKKDQKELDKIAKEAQQIIQEKQQLAAEFEVLNAQNEEIIARNEESQNQSAAAPVAEEGGLLTGSVQQNNMAVSGDDNSTLQNNQSRIVSISSRFTALDKKLNTSQTKVRTINATSRTRHKKYEKLAKAKEKIIKEYQKKEQEKQARVEKSLSVISIANNIFSITMSTGTILMLWPVTAAVGATLVNIGLNGMTFCSLVKSVVLMANGNFKEAFTTMAMTSIQIATSFIPGAGAAATATTTALSTTTQAVGAGLSIVSSIADTAAQGQTLAGKEQSGWLNTVSQVAGAASALTNVAGGFAKGGAKIDSAGNIVENATSSAFKQSNTFGKVLQIAQAVGTTATTTAQISALIKQANGEETGNFENILNLIGFSISAAASLGQIGMKISEAASNKKELKNKTDNQDITESIDDANTVIDDETQQEIEGAQTQTVDEETIEETDKILASNVDNESEGINATPEDKTETEVEAAAGAGDKSQQETKDQLAEEQTLANNLAENEGLTAGKSKRIAGDKFEITEDGKYLVNDKEVSADDFSKSIGEAKAKAEVKQEKLNKAIEIGSAVLEAGSQGLQVYSAIQSLTEATEQEDQRNVLSLSDMQKGKSLIRKIKKRRAALFGYTRSA